MEHTRLEILKNGVWEVLILKEYNNIRYNVLINKVGSMSNRQISKSNTFELPYTAQNIKALGINVFNKTELAKAFNARYVARYYIKDKLCQNGYLIINNTNNGTINVNFYDQSLDLIEQWGTITYYDLLSSTTLAIPEDYKPFIEDMKTYVINQNAIMPPLQRVNSRGNFLAKFPNNLNTIGDKFQLDKDSIRQIDSFNPYQSRPIFNVKAMFDIAIESFGFTAYYDNSVDWQRLAETYLVSAEQAQSSEGANAEKSVTYPTINSQMPALTMTRGIFPYVRTNFIYPQEVNAIYPKDLSPMYYMPNFWDWNVIKNYPSLDRCILIPNTSASFSGVMQWKFQSIDISNKSIETIKVYALWKRISSGEQYTTILNVDEYEVNTETNFTKVVVNKSQLAFTPSDASGLIGVILDVMAVNRPSDVSMAYMTYTETYEDTNGSKFDQYNQFINGEANLLDLAPRETVKDLLSAIMQKEGILMSFDMNAKIVKMFTYGSYITRKVEGKFKDWSNYFLRYMPLSYNTDYGSEYAIKNEVGLNTPYKGNTVIVDLVNQGENSKYKDFTENFSKKLKDVEAVTFIQNNNTPYFEYTNKGLGLVESPPIGLGQLRQVRADGVSQGVFTGLAQVFNVNCLNLPNGLAEWYDLIDNSVRVEAQFLLPVLEVRNIDMSEPVFVEGLGGFYIIEEISEYVDAQTPVIVKLIKMIIPTLSIIPEPEDFNYDEFTYNSNSYT